MKRKPYPVSSITGGLVTNLDPILLTDTQSPNLSLVKFHKGILRKMWGFSSFASPAAERLMLFDIYRQYDGDVYTLCASVDHAYSCSSGSWSKISGTGPVFTGAESDIFYSTTFGNLWIVTNGKDVIQTYSGSAWANLGGTPPICRYFQPFYSRLVCGCTTESGTLYPHRVRWSIAGNPADWSAAGSGAIDILDTQDVITGMAVLGDRLFIFKTDTIWECYYVGGTDVFKVRMVTKSVGCVAGKTIVNIRQKLYFFSGDNIYAFDGSTCTPLASGIFDYLYVSESKVVDTANLSRAHSSYDSEAGEYITFLPTLDNSTPNLCLVLSVDGQSFSRRTKVCTAVGYFYDVAGLTIWSAATTHWHETAWDIAWRQNILASGMPTLLYGGITGVVEKMDKLTKSLEELIWESKDFIFSHHQRFVECRFLVKGDPFYVKYSVDEGQSWTTPKLMTPSTTSFTEISDHDLNFTSLRLRVNISTANDDFELKWVEPWYLPRVEPAFA